MKTSWLQISFPVIICFLLVLLCSSKAITVLKEDEASFLIASDTCIFDQSNHVAFTTLKEWKGNLYLAFREANGHHATLTDKGKIRVLKKENGNWKTEVVFSNENIDLRDPFLLEWKGALYMYTVNGYFSKLVAQKWTNLSPIIHNVNHPIGIWKIRKYRDTLYGIGYRNGKWPVLLSSIDGISWKSLKEVHIGGNASEGDLLFLKDSLFVCLRIDTPVGSNSVWGRAKYPFDDFEWNLMKISVASPELCYDSISNNILLAGREYDFGRKERDSINVSLFALNGSGLAKRLFVFNTGRLGDKGYPSFCLLDDESILVSYYTGTTRKSVIRIVSLIRE